VVVERSFFFAGGRRLWVFASFCLFGGFFGVVLVCFLIVFFFFLFE